MQDAPSPFLTAEWRWLVMLNYVASAELLTAFLPRGTELDVRRGQPMMSLVGFLFLGTRVRGFAVPFHQNFEEVNLRFYVRRRTDDGWRRGVVFIREIVPRRVIAAVARIVYNEQYYALPMRHRLPAQPELGGEFEFAWKWRGQWQSLGATTRGTLHPIVANSDEEFIFEHYWGYSRQRDGGTVEYAVEHPRWRVWQTSSTRLEFDAAAFYGSGFAETLALNPHSAFIAEGSPVLVRRGVRLSD